MDVSTITVADFKARFTRDFPYLPLYDSTISYDVGTITYYPATNGAFYQCLARQTLNITPGTDPTRWVRYQGSIDDYVLDHDIQNAFDEATICFNPSLFGTDAQVTLGFLYMAAHYLCNDLKAARSGVFSTGAFPVSSRAAGSISESYAIPEAYLENPIFAMYTQSAYGMKFLAMALPAINGNVVAVFGGSQP